MQNESAQAEFLKLAAVWLSCRFRVMHGNSIIGCKIPFDLPGEFLGCSDYAGELRLLCREVKGASYRNT